MQDHSTMGLSVVAEEAVSLAEGPVLVVVLAPGYWLVLGLVERRAGRLTGSVTVCGDCQRHLVYLRRW